jgi:hypothetical protein
VLIAEEVWQSVLRIGFLTMATTLNMKCRYPKGLIAVLRYQPLLQGRGFLPQKYKTLERV